MKTGLRILVIFLVMIFIWRILQQSPQEITLPREEVWTVMGTVASLRTPGSGREHFPAMLQIAKDTFDEVNTALSVYNPKSELSTLHTKGIIDPMSDITRDFLHVAMDMTARSLGFFDPTLLPVIQLWGFSGGERPSPLPTSAQIQNALDRPTLSELEITPTSARFLGNPGHIDPGGIAKGFALDRAFEKITQKFPGVDFLLNLGGEMRAKGAAGPDRAWRIGVQNPFDKNAAIGVIRLPDNHAVATSGHYERYFEKNGIRYAHIIDPRTGSPVTGMAGVTVLAPNSTYADVLSTALFVAGLDHAKHLLDAFPGTEALLIPDRKPIEIYVTQGLKPWFDALPAFQNHVQLLPGSPEPAMEF